MSDTLGRFHFLAWTRRGIAANLVNQDTGAALSARASLSIQVTVTVNGAPAATQPAAVGVQLYGPGDIIGIDPRHVIRTEPRDNTANYEPNYLCGIEFDAPDFPWLFTPAAPNGNKLRPWLVLIVLADGEYIAPTQAPNPLPVIQVQSVATLPDLADSWNWAHTQIAGDTPLADAIASSPGSVTSRLLCPRRLAPETGYTAFLVPAFDVGVQAGTGQPPASGASANPAWTHSTPGPISLPFYYTFRFRTSDAGDFESLVRALTPTVLPGTVGVRPMDVSQPGVGLPSAGAPLGLQGAIGSVSVQPTLWEDPAKTQFQTALQGFINQPVALEDDPANPNVNDPVIAAPIYGRWLAAVATVDSAAAGWVNELNLDPRNRAAAGMGTQVVQSQSTQLMASAWQQVDGILKANQTLIQAQLARATSQQLLTTRFSIAQPASLVSLTAPLHARLLASPTTILAKVRASRVPERMFSPTFRRLTRPRRRIGYTSTSTALLERVNSGALSFVPPIVPPNGLVSIDQVTASVPGVTGSPGSAGSRGRLLLWLIVLLLLLVIVAGFIGGGSVALIAGLAGVVASVVVWSNSAGSAAGASAGASATAGTTTAGMTPATVASLPSQPGFSITPAGSAPAATATAASAPDSPAAAAFRTATAALFDYTSTTPTDPAQMPALDLAALHTTLLMRINPVTTLPRRVQARITLPARITWKPLDALEPIMAAPVFPQPMYVPLRDLSEQYVLPGADLVPPTSVGLLEADRAFIEAYMTGLNAEMGRLLLWYGYPTDQRGSCFRQFWDVSAYVPQPSDPTDPAALTELLKDIPPINTWPTSTALGTHPNRPGLVENNVVLLVRGELFRRYPNTIVYAGKAMKSTAPTADPNGRVLDPSDERYPLFRGTLGDDMTFFGFNLSVADAYGGTAASPEGFFFVFQQQPTEPRFGLEPNELSNPTTHWADLAWTNFAALPSGAGAGAGGIYTLPNLGATTRGGLIRNSPWRLASQVFSLVNASVTLPAFLSSSEHPQRTAIASDTPDPEDAGNRWGQNSAQTAYVLMRMPFRILIHADMMLPQPPPPVPA